MCGLVGMAGHLTFKHRDMMRDLLFFNTLRGKDSTGVASISRERKVDLRKITVPGYEFIDLPFFDTLCGLNDQLWLGHGRFKTVGGNTRSNAHPFQVVDDEGFIETIGAHNGTLSNKHEIEDLLAVGRFGTDSEALIYLIAKLGGKEALAQAKGAWSLTFWDAEKNTINFVRNKERPMTYAFSEDLKVLMWASEAWMILAAARRAGISLADTDKGSGVYMTTEDTLYTIEIPQGLNTVFGEFTKEGGVQGKPEPVFQKVNNGAWVNRFWEGGSKHDAVERNVDDRRNGGFVPKTEAQMDEEEASDGKKILTIGNPPKSNGIVGYKGKRLSVTEYAEICESGCGWCEQKVLGTHVAFLDEKTVICSSCLCGSTDKARYTIARNKAEAAKVSKQSANNVVQMAGGLVKNEVQSIISEAQKKVGGKK